MAVSTSSFFHPRSAAEVPATPLAFPRNNWLSLEAFGFPPYNTREYKYEACWAAAEASMSWSRTLGVAAEVDTDGTPYVPAVPRAPAVDVVDDTVFMLALFDKVHEIMWYASMRAVFDKNRTRQTALQWTTWTDDLVESVYDTACKTLKKTPGRERPAPTFEEVYWFVRDALDVCGDEWDLVARPPRRPEGYIPFPTSVLGRFAATYAQHSYVEVIDVPGAEERLVTVPASADVPAPWQPVEEGAVYAASGLHAALKLKDAYRAEQDAFYDDFEHATLQCDPLSGAQLDAAIPPTPSAPTVSSAPTRTPLPDLG